MPPRRAIYGKISKAHFVPNKGPEVTGIDSQLLLSRLLFFDEVVVDSTNLGELPYLAKMFGVDGLQELLNSNLLKLASEKSFVITDIKMNGKRQIPLLQFDEGIAASQDNDHNLETKMKSLLKISGLSNAKREELDKLVRSKLVKLSSSYGTRLLAQIRKNLTSDIELLTNILCHRHPEVPIEKLSLTAHDLGGMQRFESNLKSMLGITEEQEHQILAEVVTGVSNLNQRITDMEEYSAISHFATDAHLFVKPKRCDADTRHQNYLDDSPSPMGDRQPDPLQASVCLEIIVQKELSSLVKERDQDTGDQNYPHLQFVHC